MSKCKEKKAERNDDSEQTIIKLTGMTFADIDLESLVLEKLQVSAHTFPPPPPPPTPSLPSESSSVLRPTTDSDQLERILRATNSDPCAANSETVPPSTAFFNNAMSD